MSSDLELEHDAMIDVLHDPIRLGATLRVARKSVSVISHDSSIRSRQ